MFSTKQFNMLKQIPPTLKWKGRKHDSVAVQSTSNAEAAPAPDGEEQDAYILGVRESVKEFTGKLIGVICRKNDIEEKWVVCPEHMNFTKTEIAKAVEFQEQYFDIEITCLY